MPARGVRRAWEEVERGRGAVTAGARGGAAASAAGLRKAPAPHGSTRGARGHRGATGPPHSHRTRRAQGSSRGKERSSGLVTGPVFEVSLKCCRISERARLRARGAARRPVYGLRGRHTIAGLRVRPPRREQAVGGMMKDRQGLKPVPACGAHWTRGALPAALVTGAVALREAVPPTPRGSEDSAP